MLKKIPSEQGFVGTLALREAAATEFRDVIRLVRAAIIESLKHPLGGRENRDIWVHMLSVFADHAVVEQGERYVSYPYTIGDDNQVTLGAPVEVVREWKPVTATAVREAWDDPLIRLAEAKDGAKEGSLYRIRVIEAGLSGNHVNYTDAALKTLVPHLNSARVFVKSDAEHIKGQGKDFNKLIGGLSHARFIEGQKTNTGYVEADFAVLQSAGEVSAKLLEAVQRNMSDLFGFSIDADAVCGKPNKTTRIREARRFTKVHSVDLIIQPGAGGGIVRLIEAQAESTQPHETEQGNPMNETMKRLLEALKKTSPNLFDGVNMDDDAAVTQRITEALALKNQPPATDTPSLQDQMEQVMQLVEAKAEGKAAVKASGLPEAAQARLIEAVSNAERVTDDTVKTMIDAEKEYLGRVTESGRVQMPEGGARYGDAPDGKEMLDKLLDPANKDVISLKEAYVECTGDKHITGEIRKCSTARLKEALDSSSFPAVLGDSITRRMVNLYQTPTVFDAWRAIADVVPVNDFRTQERTRYGGYGDLPVVAEKGDYAALSSPSDEKATYAVSKRGGTETITLEMITNDDVGALLRIPTNLTRAAKRTLNKFVFDFIKVNPKYLDSKTLFHVAHKNLLSVALGDAGIAQARLMLAKQTEMDSNEQLGFLLKNLLVPAELEQTAYDMFKRDTNNDETFIQSLKPSIIPVAHWTDPNDWAVTTDKADCPLIEVGFLHGQEEPEIFIQDSPTVGSMFTNDQTTYKIRHIYGGNALDYRGMVKSVVA